MEFRLIVCFIYVCCCISISLLKEFSDSFDCLISPIEKMQDENLYPIYKTNRNKEMKGGENNNVP